MNEEKFLWKDVEGEIEVKSWLGICASNDEEYRVIETKIVQEIVRKAIASKEKDKMKLLQDIGYLKMNLRTCEFANKELKKENDKLDMGLKVANDIVGKQDRLLKQSLKEKIEKWFADNMFEEDHYSKKPRKIVRLLKADMVKDKVLEIIKEKKP